MFYMDVDIKFCKSAFKHGVTEADIRWAFKTIKYDAILEEPGWTDKHRQLRWHTYRF
jgi:hypothetical protein